MIEWKHEGPEALERIVEIPFFWPGCFMMMRSFENILDEQAFMTESRASLILSRQFPLWTRNPVAATPAK